MGRTESRRSCDPDSEDLASLNADRYGRKRTRRLKSESHGMQRVTSSPELLPQLSDFDVVDIHHLMAVAQFEAGRSLLRNNPALGLILARWQLCCRSHERVLWWELQDEMKVGAETTRAIGEALASGPATMLAAAAFPTDERPPDVVADFGARLVRMQQQTVSVCAEFSAESAAVLYCRELLANSSLSARDVLQPTCPDIQ
ncbi:MAG: hypothetical protein IPH50_14935 [Rhodanobacteraceae bacterium]|nr:hypothetical protein [Rhodanobacteraceae bacterium]